jgi:DNA-binding transcriptional LysR family regulator
MVSAGHPLAQRDELQADEVTRYPFLTGLRTSRYMALVGAALRQIGIERYEVAMELQDSVSVKEMLRHSRSIAVLPACAVEQEIATGTLRALQMRVQPPALELRCAYREPLSTAARMLLAHLRPRS